MIDKIQIRKAAETDIPKIVEIYNEALIESPYVQDNHPHTIETRTRWYNQRQAEELPIYVAETAGHEVIGFANLNTFLTPEYNTTVHVSVYVAKSGRGLGTGKMLVHELITWSRANGKHTILAGIDSENAASIRLHQSFGFIEVAAFKEVISKFGQYRDLNFYQLLLTQ